MIQEHSNYSKNFLTGELTVVDKTKDQNAMATGVYTVQLFDTNGNLIEEAVSENVVSKIPYAEAYKHKVFRALYEGIDYAGDNGTITSTKGSIYHRGSNRTFIYGINQGYASNICLMNSDGFGEEDAFDPWVIGDLIGWANCHLTYSGSDTKKGTLNTAESSYVTNYLPNSRVPTSYTANYVFDFPTHCANGTFDNIYLTSSTESTTSDYRLNSTVQIWEFDINSDFHGFSTGGASDAGCFSYDDNYLYMHCFGYGKSTTTTSSDHKSDKRNYYYTINRRTFEVEKKELPTAYRMIVHAMGNIWGIKENYIVDKYTLTGELSETIDLKPKLQSPLNLTTYAYLCGNQCSTGNQRYLFLIYRSNSGFRVAVFNPELEVVFDKVVQTSNSDSSTGLGVSIIEYKGKVYFFEDKEGVVYSTETWEPAKIPLNHYRKRSTSGSNNEYSTNSLKIDNYLYYADICGVRCRTIAPWGSHTKLPAPITKTKDYTMKIKYSLTVEYVGSHDINKLNRIMAECE